MERTKRDLLLRLLALSGEMPTELVSYIVGSATYAAYLVTCLKKEGYIAVRNRDGIKGYVLLSKGKKELLHDSSDDFSLYLTGNVETNRVKSEMHRRLRLHRMSMVWAFFNRIHIRIFATVKPNYPPQATEIGKNLVYYGATEFKCGAEHIKGSRACGILCSGDMPFVVYHTMEQLMKWSKKTERAMRSFVEGSLVGSGYAYRADAIVIGKSMDMLRILLESDGGLKGNLFQVDDIYDHYYYFSMSTDCYVQMMLTADQEKDGQFRKLLEQAVYKIETKEYALADGYDRDGVSVYFCYKLDLAKLVRMKQEMMWKGTGKVYCLDYQVDVLREYFSSKVEVCAIVTQKALEYLYGGKWDET